MRLQCPCTSTVRTKSKERASAAPETITRTVNVNSIIIISTAAMSDPLTLAEMERTAVALQGHATDVLSVCFHPANASLLATASWDETAKVWNHETQECIATLRGHTNYVRSVCFHPANTSLLATASNDETAKVWNHETQECIATLRGHTSAVRSVCFHPANASLLATASDDKTAKVWNHETQECIATLRGHTGGVYNVCFHPTNASLLATASDDKTAKVWTLPGLEHLAPFWSVELQCTPAQSSRSSSSSAALHGRPFLHFVLLVGEAMCRSCVEPDARDAGTVDCCSAGAAAAWTVGPDAGNGAEIVHARQQQQQRAEPLPSEIWLHILSFLRVNELLFSRIPLGNPV